MSAYMRWMTYPSMYLHLWWRGVSKIRQIGLSVTNNFLIMIFALLLSTYSQHPCRMKWVIKIRTITPFTTNIGVTSCPPCRWNIIKSKPRLKSKYLWSLSQRHPILIAMHIQSCQARRRQVLVSYRTTSKRIIKTPIIKFLIITLCCARSLEFLRAIINRKDQKIALGGSPTSIPSRKALRGA